MTQPGLMSPLGHALCDRFIIEAGYVRFLAGVLPDLSLERIVPANGWTVRQTFNHIVAVLGEFPEMFVRLLHGDSAQPAGFDRDAANAAQAASTGTTSLLEIITRLGPARTRFLALLEDNDSALETALPDGRTLAEVVARWAHHSARHCLEIVEALPELHTDPLVLTWLIGSDLGDAAETIERQERLRQSAIAAFDAAEEELHAP